MTDEQYMELGADMVRRDAPRLTDAQVATLRVILGTDRPTRSMIERKYAA